MQQAAGLHSAAASGETAAICQQFAAAPGAALAGDACGRTPLYLAARCGHEAAVQCLLELAPQAAAVKAASGLTPLHCAAVRGSATCIRRLFEAAPEAATAGDQYGNTPLHVAAEFGREAAVQCLLELAPQAASLRAADGSTPLQRAIEQQQMAAARPLFAFGRAADVLAALQAAGEAALPLFGDYAAAHLPLSEAQWSAVPIPCPGLGRVLPAALANSPAQARQLVAHLPPADAEKMRVAALCLARAQRRLRTPLPVPILQRVLSLCLLDS